MASSAGRSGGCPLGAILLVAATVLVLSPGAAELSAIRPGPASSAVAFPPGVSWAGDSVRPVPDHEPGLGVPGARVVGPATVPSLRIVVTFPYSHPEELGRYLSQLSDPSSPLYHQYLTRTQFDERFGGAAPLYRAAITYFQSFGAQRLTTYGDRATLAFDVTPGQVDRLFHVPIAEFRDPAGRSYYAPVGVPGLPAPLASAVIGLEGLSDYSTYLLHTESRAHAGQTSPPVPSTGRAPPPPSSFKPTPCSSAGGPFACTRIGKLSYPQPYGNLSFASELQVAYGEGPLFQGSGYPTHTTVATILWVDPIDNSSGMGRYCAGLSSANYAAPFDPGDVRSFFSFTLPSKEPRPTVVGVPILDGTGQAPPPGASASCDSGGTDFESTLDVDMAGSLAPGAGVYEVYGDNGNSGTTDLAFADILNPNSSEGAGMTPGAIAALDNVSAISNSWGYGLWNDTAWYADLQQAQARGITVLAATPDAGANVTNAPAGQAYDTFGDVAVGGTTLVLNATTLRRSSEVAWYEGPGSHSGTSGGVADSTAAPANCGTGPAQCFPEPSWQRASADANAVIRAVGDGRGEPDVAAIANNTLISITYAGNNYPITCIATGGCAFFILTGDSIATPVEAGIVATIDHALRTRGVGALGFLDPGAYALGQAERNGTFARRSAGAPFFDVVAGSNANFSALPGYDLVTGWGPIAADPYSQYELPHAVSFTEAGLPAGTVWSVAFDGLTRNSTSSTIVFSASFGTYTYSVGPVSGFTSRPTHGTVTELGLPLSVKVRFT